MPRKQQQPKSPPSSGSNTFQPTPEIAWDEVYALLHLAYTRAETERHEQNLARLEKQYAQLDEFFEWCRTHSDPDEQLAKYEQLFGTLGEE